MTVQSSADARQSAEKAMRMAKRRAGADRSIDLNDVLKVERIKET